jgi:hypothetical protein
MFPPTPDAIHQIAAGRRREARADADAHRATRGTDRHRRSHRSWPSWLRVPLVPRAESPLDPTVARPRQV